MSNRRRTTLLLTLLVAACSAGDRPLAAQPHSQPNSERGHVGTLLAGHSCYEDICVFQGGFRAASVGPGVVGLDISFLVGSEAIGSALLLDLGLAHSARLTPWLYLAPRLGLSLFGLPPSARNPPWIHLGGGLVALIWNRLALRADVVYRRRLPEFVEGDGLVSLTLGVGLRQ